VTKQNPLYVINSKVKQEALSFIQLEKERVLHNFENGTIDREQTIGSLNTLYQIASHMKDMECMKNLCQTIAAMRAETTGLHVRLPFRDQSSMG
jgi:hypothetical protein